MLGGFGVYLAHHAAQPLFYQLLQGPAGTVAGEHGKVMEVHFAASVGGGYLGVVYFGKPIVGRYRAAVGEYQPTNGIGGSGVFPHTESFFMDVIVYRFLVVQYCGLEVAKLFALPSVNYVRLCNVGVPRLYKYLFGAVLYGLHAYEVVLYLILKVRSDLQRDEVYIVGIAGLVQSAECLGYRPAYLGYIEFGYTAVPLYHPIHPASP